MRLPRDVSGRELADRRRRLGYHVTRQTGSHIRLTRSTEAGSYHITIPAHDALRVGTLNSVLRDVAEHLQISKAELIKQLWADD